MVAGTSGSPTVLTGSGCSGDFQAVVQMPSCSPRSLPRPTFFAAIVCKRPGRFGRPRQRKPIAAKNDGAIALRSRQEAPGIARKARALSQPVCKKCIKPSMLHTSSRKYKSSPRRQAQAPGPGSRPRPQPRAPNPTSPGRTDTAAPAPAHPTARDWPFTTRELGRTGLRGPLQRAADRRT
jgi:hypothetical protein